MNILTATALAEEALNLTEEQQEALAGGLIVGISIGVIIALGLVYFILRVIADWKIFTKAGEAGWKSIIPILSEYTEYGICWKGVYGLAFGAMMLVQQYIAYFVQNPAGWVNILSWVLFAVCLVLHWIQSMRLAKAFGKGGGFGFGLFLLGPIFRLVLGFGKARYVGHPGD